MRGETKPYIYTVLTICDALDVTIADLLEKQVSEYSEDEEVLIRVYRSLSSEKKRMIKVYMDMLSKYNGELWKIMSIFSYIVSIKRKS